MTEALTIEQADERLMLIRRAYGGDPAASSVIEHYTVKEATPNGQPDENGWQTWTISANEGGTFGGFRLPPNREAPMVGDPYTLYGGFGSVIFGGDLRDRACWYKTEVEREAERSEWLDANARRKAEWYADNKDRLDAEYDALPAALQRRIDRFVTNCPTDWWAEFGGYEMSALAVAVAVWDHVKDAPDPRVALTDFAEADYHDQASALPEGIMDGLSGNQFGYAMNVAGGLVAGDEFFLEWGHGAMTPLAGCPAYGCITPVDAGVEVPE